MINLRDLPSDFHYSCKHLANPNIFVCVGQKSHQDKYTLY